MLAAREERACRQQVALRHASTVVSLTVVSPGPVKRSPAIERLFAAAAEQVTLTLLDRGWRVTARTERHPAAGPELVLGVDAPAPLVKAAMVDLEDAHPWGRLWDVDVVTAAGPLSRTELGRLPRRCLVCGDPAAACARSRRHGADEVAAAVARIAAAPGTGRPPTPPRDPHRTGALAAEALRTEARLAPKPGLVDALTPGAHRDMTLGLLLASADTLEPGFVALTGLGARPGWRVDEAQALGIAAEDAMLQVTGGVNTHRGAIYLLGWLCVAAGEADEPTVPGLATRVAELTTPALQAWRAGAAAGPGDGPRPDLSGARGEAASGLACTVGTGLPALRTALRRGWSDDDALLAALVALLARLDDTNVVRRGGVAALRRVQAWAADLAADDPPPQRLRAALAEADATFTAQHLSPGGCADLLAATWFLHRLVPEPWRTPG